MNMQNIDFNISKINHQISKIKKSPGAPSSSNANLKQSGSQVKKKVLVSEMDSQIQRQNLRQSFLGPGTLGQNASLQGIYPDDTRFDLKRNLRMNKMRK